MKISVFVNNQSEFRMRLQSENKGKYQNLETLTLTNVDEKDIYTFMRNAGFNRNKSQSLDKRIKRFDTSKFKLAVSDCKKYIFYLGTRYSLAFVDGEAYVAPFSLNDQRRQHTDSKFSDVAITYPGKQAYFLGKRKVETVLSLPEEPKQPKRITVISNLTINYSIEFVPVSRNEATQIMLNEIASISINEPSMTTQEAVNLFKRDFPEQYENWLSISDESVLTKEWFLTKLDAHIENGKLIHPSSMLTSINRIYTQTQKAKKESREHQADEDQFLNYMANQ
ncbi:hypothetical protein [Vibrio parahaemolyticus]|uniref:hypothetical protein n=1 Tax=Vibrio parahaemolyticus TaxID=670 RepID=UPI0023610F21|nr:hypothetical protein [Vibrio parahaemolyticus]MDF4441344.1 hypothetical protein [Vibrio parahaemolyticus]HCG7925584.1 hypothetical protein [Vibrio parahaemolyticus]HCH0781494.1 hypothetical protein [Vibrio parahaemolyticus]